MPGFDRTGPRGQGQGSGEGMGPCGGGSRVGWGRRFGSGSGGLDPCRGLRRRSRGERAWGYDPYGTGPVPGYGISRDAVQALKVETDYLKSELEAVRNRLAEVELNKQGR